MKSVTMNAMLATAAWMVASTAASAAELKFDVPFAFQAGSKTMAPGKYVVRASNDEVHFPRSRIRNPPRLGIPVIAKVRTIREKNGKL